MSMLKVENLKKVFRTEEIETIALNGVTFEVIKQCCSLCNSTEICSLVRRQ